MGNYFAFPARKCSSQNGLYPSQLRFYLPSCCPTQPVARLLARLPETELPSSQLVNLSLALFNPSQTIFESCPGSVIELFVQPRHLSILHFPSIQRR